MLYFYLRAFYNKCKDKRNLPEKVKSLSNVLHIIPALVLLFEYVVVSSALAYARFAVELDPQPVRLLGGIIEVGGNLPFDAVPNAVVTLHLLGLFLSVSYFVYFVVFSSIVPKEQQSIPPQEG